MGCILGSAAMPGCWRGSGSAPTPFKSPAGMSGMAGIFKVGIAGNASPPPPDEPLSVSETPLDERDLALMLPSQNMLAMTTPPTHTIASTDRASRTFLPPSCRRTGRSLRIIGRSLRSTSEESGRAAAADSSRACPLTCAGSGSIARISQPGWLDAPNAPIFTCSSLQGETAPHKNESRHQVSYCPVPPLQKQESLSSPGAKFSRDAGAVLDGSRPPERGVVSQCPGHRSPPPVAHHRTPNRELTKTYFQLHFILHFPGFCIFQSRGEKNISNVFLERARPPCWPTLRLRLKDRFLVDLHPPR